LLNTNCYFNIGIRKLRIPMFMYSRTHLVTLVAIVSGHVKLFQVSYRGIGNESSNFQD